MRFAERTACASALLLAASVPLHPESLSIVHRQLYAMGTMFDIVVHHASRPDAERAVNKASDEVLRLDTVMSHFKPGSDLSRLNREGSTRAVAVDVSLFEVIQRAAAVSRRSGGRFDVTVAPLLKVWKAAAAAGRVPPAGEIASARKCVGYEYLELTPPNLIRFRSACLELDLGGIGKGYAVDRAMAILRSAGIEHAMINAGGSSIAAIGNAPHRNGWPVLLGAHGTDGKVLLLRDSSVSTSHQDPAHVSGGIVDPRRGTAPDTAAIVSVVTPDATLADALSTTLLMMTVDEAGDLLASFGDVSALWVDAAGQVHALYGASRLQLLDGSD
jgi:thiamine biosynthesis lipoprotein